MSVIEIINWGAGMGPFALIACVFFGLGTLDFTDGSPHPFSTFFLLVLAIFILFVVACCIGRGALFCWGVV